MKVTKIKLVSYGLSGANVEFNSNDLVDGVTYDGENKKRCKAPVPSVVTDKIKSLQVFFLDICGYWSKSWDDFYDFDNMCVIKQTSGTSDYMEMMALLQDVVITDVEYNGSSFVIAGRFETRFGGKVVNLKSPKIVAGDDYDQFHVVCTILAECMKSAKSYIKGDIVQDPKQYVIEYSKQKGHTEEEIKDILRDMNVDDYKQFMIDKGTELNLVVVDEDELLKDMDIIEHEGLDDNTDITMTETHDEMLARVKEEENIEEPIAQGTAVEEIDFMDVEASDSARVVNMKVAV